MHGLVGRNSWVPQLSNYTFPSKEMNGKNEHVALDNATLYTNFHQIYAEISHFRTFLVSTFNPCEHGENENVPKLSEDLKLWRNKHLSRNWTLGLKIKL